MKYIIFALFFYSTHLHANSEKEESTVQNKEETSTSLKIKIIAKQTQMLCHT